MAQVLIFTILAAVFGIGALIAAGTILRID
jgi:hypothetical protein